MDSRKTIKLVISGQVQGVFFRSSMKKVAEGLGVTGWVRNMPDGRVEAVIQGQEDVIRELVEWCGRGPSGAAEDRVVRQRTEWCEN
jgi:acylphosphatase